MARPGGDSLCALLPVPNLRGSVDWARESERVRDGLLADYETTFGLTGLTASIAVEHRMTPLDFERELGAVAGNAFALEPTLHQSAALRPPNRVPGVRGLLPRGRRDASGRRDPGRAARGGGHGGARGRGLRGEEGACCLPRREDATLTVARVDHEPRGADVRDRVPAAAARGARRRLPALPRLPHARRPRRRRDARRRRARGGGRGVVLRPTRSARPRRRCSPSLDARYALPRDALLEFCRGMRDDLGGRVVTTEEELDTYCYRVAGTVGIVMSALLGVVPGAGDHRPSAAALGKAMQRTNILRDIDEDLAAGRVYLARETVERYGSWGPGEREELLRDQIARADALYDEGIAGIPLLASRPRRDPRGGGDVPRDPAADRARGLRRAGRPRGRAEVAQAHRRGALGPSPLRRHGVASGRVPRPLRGPRRRPGRVLAAARGAAGRGDARDRRAHARDVARRGARATLLRGSPRARSGSARSWSA